jgi:hypothetical protein
MVIIFPSRTNQSGSLARMDAKCEDSRQIVKIEESSPLMETDKVHVTKPRRAFVETQRSDSATTWALS